MKEIPQGTYYELWFSDLEKIIDEFYGQEDYSVLDQLDGDFRNGMYALWDTADGEEFIGENWDGLDRQEEFKEWVAGEPAMDPDPRALLWDMAEKGHIPKGKYLIHIWW